MKALRVITAIAIGIGVLGNPAPGAWAGSGQGGCTVRDGNPGPSNVALKGTIGVEVLNSDVAAGGGEAPIDAVLRIQKSGAASFFYASLVGLVGLNEQLVCAVLGALTPSLQSTLNL